jgi:hypothetical protein
MINSRLYDERGGWGQDEIRDPIVNEPAPDAGATTTSEPAPAPAPAPTEDPAPGPVSSPAPQGGNPPRPRPTPPAVVSSVPGVQASDVTGGVQGSFGQAGTAGFSRRFGMPAAWFRGGPTAGLAREAGNRGRGILGRERAGQVSGGYGAETVANLAGPSLGEQGGGKNDEEWQRILQAAMRNRFGRG